MIDVFADKLVTFTQVAKKLPHRPHVQTIRRWSKIGVNGVILDSVLLAGERYTTLEAVNEFIQQASKNGHHFGQPQKQQPKQPKRKHKARRRLEKSRI